MLEPMMLRKQSLICPLIGLNSTNGWPRRATPTFTVRVSNYSRRKCRGGPPWSPVVSKQFLPGDFDLLFIHSCELLSVRLTQQLRIVRKRQPRLPTMRRSINRHALPWMQQPNTFNPHDMLERLPCIRNPTTSVRKHRSCHIDRRELQIPTQQRPDDRMR